MFETPKPDDSRAEQESGLAAELAAETQFRALLRELPDRRPPPGFSSRVLARWRAEERAARARRRRVTRWVLLGAGAPAGLFWLTAPAWLLPVGRALGPGSWTEIGVRSLTVLVESLTGAAVALQSLASLQDVFMRLASTPSMAGLVAASTVVALLALRGLSGALLSEKGVGHA